MKYLVLCLLGLVMSFKLQAAQNYHVTEVVIEKPYAEVWSYVSDPLNFDKLYPNWVRKVISTGENKYHVITPSGWEHDMFSVIDKENGLIDFHIIPGEKSRSRLISIGESKTLHIHVAFKGKYMNEQTWSHLKKAVDLDYLNAKKLIEAK